MKVDGKRQEEREFVEEELVRRVEAEVVALNGVGLDLLMNPSTVLNFERDLIALRAELEMTSNPSDRAALEKKIEKKSARLFSEKRMVMRGWLKNLFLGQSILVGVVSLGMSYNAIPGQDLPLSLQVLGFWLWWLFTIPSLRARKPSTAEKEALDLAFLITPVVSILGAFVTKNPGSLWWLNAFAVAACYAYCFSRGDEPSSAEEKESTLPPQIQGVLRAISFALDYGSGRERGARK